MEFKQWQIIALIVGAFATVIAVDVLIQYKGDANFRASFPALPTAKFAKTRAPQMVAQEMRQPAAPTFADEGTSEVS